MARKTKDEKWRDAFAQHLDPDEQLLHVAFGVKQPHIGLIILFVALAVIPGLIVVMLMTKNYLVALTNKRLIVAQVSSSFKFKPGKMWDYDPGQPGGEVKTSTGMIFTHISIKNPENPFKAKFHRSGSKKNREAAMAIAAVLDPANAVQA